MGNKGEKKNTNFLKKGKKILKSKAEDFGAVQ